MPRALQVACGQRPAQSLAWRGQGGTAEAGAMKMWHFLKKTDAF